MTSNILLREAISSDHEFIMGLSPTLAEVADLAWHSESMVQKMQDAYIEEMLAPTSTENTTFIAEENNIALGFIHVRSREDEISGETCGTIPLVAVSPLAQGKGIGKLLMNAAENWSKSQGYRLLHLEVFANNQNAQQFYQRQGFKAEMLHMIKELR